MAEVYSPLRYPGGKAKLASFLIEVIYANGLKAPHYVEPYAGGAGAALRLLFEEYVESITINDADPRIRCMWQAILRYPDAFVELINQAPLTVKEWYRQRAIYEACDQRGVLKLGFATFFLNRTTRSGIVHNGGPIGGYDQSGSYKIDARFNREQLARRIVRIGAFADRIEVSGLDGLALIRKLKKQPSQLRRTLIYLDPPYYAKGGELYLNRFEHTHHAELARYLRATKPFSWLMTYDNVAEVRLLYKEYPQLPFSLSYSAYKRRTGEELLIHPPSVVVPERALAALPAMSA